MPWIGLTVPVFMGERSGGEVSSSVAMAFQSGDIAMKGEFGAGAASSSIPAGPMMGEISMPSSSHPSAIGEPRLERLAQVIAVESSFQSHVCTPVHARLTRKNHVLWRLNARHYCIVAIIETEAQGRQRRRLSKWRRAWPFSLPPTMRRLRHTAEPRCKVEQR